MHVRKRTYILQVRITVALPGKTKKWQKKLEKKTDVKEKEKKNVKEAKRANKFMDVHQINK